MGKTPIKLTSSFIIRKLDIGIANPPRGNKGDTITLTGNYFGAMPPKVWLSSGGTKMTCKIVKPYDYKDNKRRTVNPV